ncbi:MAG: hypothetical protein ACI8QC_004318 [Planctomycetota bacterium]|jgi:hypothetical protein
MAYLAHPLNGLARSAPPLGELCDGCALGPRSRLEGASLGPPGQDRPVSFGPGADTLISSLASLREARLG